MEGGEYKTQGADTCVYIPHVACARKGKTIRTAPPGTEFVSRITRDEYEVKVQKAVVKALDAIAVKGDGISQFFNLADSSCAPKFKPEDKKEECTVPDLQYNQGLINLVTPKQGDTLYRSIIAKSKPDALIKSSLKGLMIAMVKLNAEKVTHSDSHSNNLGWIGDQLVIFDWGRGTVGLEPFKAWVRRYLAWDKIRQDSWKNLSQHTLQFALLDLYPVQLTQLSSKGLFSTILSVWDTLGLLGPARAAGVVSEEKAKAFADEIFKSIKEKPNQSLTEKLKVMIPDLFGDPPAIHPIVAEKPMPPAEAKAVSRIIPAESSVVEVKAAPAPAADPDKKKLEDMKDACRKLLAPGGGRRRTFRRRKHRGGVFKAHGERAITFEAHDDTWNFLPTPTDGLPAVIKRIPAPYSPATVVAYISFEKNIMVNHDIVRGSPYHDYGLTYIAAYRCDLDKLTDAEWTKHFPVEKFPGGIGYDEREILLDAIEVFGENVPCLIIPKFKTTVANLPVKNAINAMLEILVGFCVKKDFVISDLHLNNMAIMPSGKPVTFDFDRLTTFDKFGGYLKAILDMSPIHLKNKPQYAHVLDLDPAVLAGYAKTPTPPSSIDFFINYDMLSVLSSLRVVCSGLGVPAAAAAVGAVDTCIQEISNIHNPDPDSRRPFITALRRALAVALDLGGVRGGVTVVDLIKNFKTEEAVLDKWRRLAERDTVAMTAGTRRHQKGGDFLAGGADTLVWAQTRTDEEKAAGLPEWLGLPIAYDGTTPSIPPVFKDLKTYGDPVVRMILLREGEMEMHRALKTWSTKNEFVKMHLNTFAGAGVYLTNPKVVVGKVPITDETPPDIKAALAHTYFSDANKEVKTEVEEFAKSSDKWYGLVTRRQKIDIKRLDPVPAIHALITLMQPLLRTDGFWIHYDLHDGNMALMEDGTPVIHDYGRMKFRDYDLIGLNATTPTFPSPGNLNILVNLLPEIARESGRYAPYRQFYFAALLMDDLKTDIKERLLDASKEKITNRRGLERKSLSYMLYMARTLVTRGLLYEGDSQTPMNADAFREKITGLLKKEKNDEEVRTYLNTFYKDPVYETRYYHIARIWDLLAVLKAIGLHAEKAAAAANAAPRVSMDARARPAPPGEKYDMVAVYSRGAARQLMALAKETPPNATRAEVKKIIEKFCVGAAALLDKSVFTPKSEAEQDKEAETYWANIEKNNKGRLGPKVVEPPPPPTQSGGNLDAAMLAKGKEKGEEVEVKGEPESYPKPDPKDFTDPDQAVKDELEKEKGVDEEPMTLLANAVRRAYEREYGKLPEEDKPPAEPPAAPKGGKLTRRRRLPQLY
jgi:hypothetical protein